jgi:hypothetical protein
MQTIIKTGARGGKIVGYVRGDPKRPIYWKPGMAMPSASPAPGPGPAVAPGGQQPAGGRVTAAPAPMRDHRLPVAGTTIKARFKGKDYEAVVREDHVEYGGKRYRSISAAAAEIMQHAANGYAFFGLGKRKSDVVAPAAGAGPAPAPKPGQPAPKPKAGPRDARLPKPGEVMTRTFKGAKVEVAERDGLFHLRKDGADVGAYRSLSAAATAVAGTAVNGFAFFGRQVGANDWQGWPRVAPADGAK